MQRCPHCNIEIRVRELPHQGIWKNFRICPGCGGYFTVDTKTKYRQAIFLLIAVVSLILTLLMYYQGSEWMIPAIVSYIILGIVIYWGNKHVFFVPYQEDRDITNDT